MLNKHYKTIRLIIFFLLLAIQSIAQNTDNKRMINCTGKIVNEQGEPVSATISVKGANSVTGTDTKGNFIIRGINENAELVVSGINIEPLQIEVDGRKDLGIITVTMKVIEDKEITIRANTGYQSVNPNEVNGSLVVIDNKTLNQQVGPDILKRLDGVTPGLYFNIGKASNNPQNTTNISIRGLSTINGPLDPLIVLDNFIYEGDFNNINPNDIESVTVLKDAAATSIYGARGGNGVIVITTKKAKFGQKLKVDFNSTVTVTNRPDLHYLRQMSSSDYINVEQDIFNKGYFNSQINREAYDALTPAVEIFLKRRQGLISAHDSATQINSLKSVNNIDQFENLFYRKAVLQQYGLTLSGGSKNNAWLISGGYNNNIGNLKATDNKANIRIDNTYRPVKNLELNVSLYYTNDKKMNGARDYNSIVQIGNRKSVPYISFAGNNRDALPVSLVYNKDYVDSAGQGKLLDWSYYPLIDYLHDVTKTINEDYVSNLQLNYTFLHSLQLSVHYQLEKQQTSYTRNSDAQSYYARDLINKFSQLDVNSGTMNYLIPQGSIVQNSLSALQSQNFRAQLNYHKASGLHDISAIAGSEIREVVTNGNGSSVYGYNQQPLTQASVDFTNEYPTFITGDYAAIPNGPYISATTTNRFVSLFGNASYEYKQRYSLSGSVRKDGSNIFGLKTNDKWQPLWSAGAGWVLSNEPFYKSGTLSWLKLRVSYGVSGNVDLSRSPLPIAYTETNYISNLPYSRIITINNPELKWEQSKQINFGLDFKLGKDFITGTVEYYLKTGTNLYGETPYDYTTWGGAAEIVENVADMKGHGMDVSLRTKDIGNQLKWNSAIILSSNESKTTKYYSQNSQNVFSLLGGGNTIIPVVGKPLYGIVAFRWGGLDDEGNPQGFLNGKRSTDYASIIDSANSKQLASGSIKYIGAATPLVFGSFINSFRWKEFSLSFNLSYRFGYYFRKATLNYDALINSGIGNSDYDKKWQKPGDELTTNVPSFVYTNYPQFSNRSYFYSNAEVNVLKADNIRLQYLNLAYTFSARNKKTPFEFLQLYINGSDLGILWRANKENLDPDYPNTLMVPKSYSIGVRATF
jgi:TonB-dependent starch-binding outer membrane protein SusC